MKNIEELNLKDKKYIIFDLDGTLIDSIGIWNDVDNILIKRYTDIDRNLIDELTTYKINSYKEFIEYINNLYNNKSKTLKI